MMDEIDDPEQLVPATDVFELLASEYDRKRNGRDWAKAQNDALLAIVTRLMSGATFAWASACRIDSTDPRVGHAEGCLFDPLDFYVQDSPGVVPIQFWSNFQSAPKGGYTFDEVTGDFRFSYVDDEFRSREGIAQSVYLNRKGLPPFVVTPWTHSDQLRPAAADESESRTRSQVNRVVGRRPANWWPDFATELAIRIHEKGLPDTQEALIADVQAALVGRGKDEPSRAQIQPVIREIFARLRQAGNS